MASLLRRAVAPVGGVAVAVGVIAAHRSHSHRLQASYTTVVPPPPDLQPHRHWDYNWDKCEPESLKHPKKDQSDEEVASSATRYVLLVRHGQYNLKGETDAQRELTELGVAQAHYTGERLKELGLPISKVTHSTMTRAHQTCQHILEHLDLQDTPVEATDLLREGAPIPPEPPVGHWRPEKAKFHTDGARIEAAFRKYFHRAPPSQSGDSYELLVCHANVIRYMVCRGLQFPPEGWLRLSLGNGSITLLVVRPDGRVSLRNLGDTGHMPPHAVTFT